MRILIETSPLAILTLDHSGRVALANESARQLLGFEDELAARRRTWSPTCRFCAACCTAITPAANMRTNVECKAQRRNGEVFLAHVWLSTYRTSQGPGLAAVVWDASRKPARPRRRGPRFDDGHFARADRRHLARDPQSGFGRRVGPRGAWPRNAPVQGNEQYQALGTLIHGLEKIASSGLRAASDREAVVADLGTVLDETAHRHRAGAARSRHLAWSGR